MADMAPSPKKYSRLYVRSYVHVCAGADGDESSYEIVFEEEEEESSFEEDMEVRNS